MPHLQGECSIRRNTTSKDIHRSACKGRRRAFALAPVRTMLLECLLSITPLPGAKQYKLVDVAGPHALQALAVIPRAAMMQGHELKLEARCERIVSHHSFTR